MELQDGFIVGIFNYCDAWCDACRFTSYCRVFADRAKYEAEADPNFKALAEAPPLAAEAPPPPPAWMQEMFEDLNEASKEPLTPEELEALVPKPSPEHQHIEERAKAYSVRATNWLDVHAGGSSNRCDPRNPADVIGWFAYFIPAKVHRAIRGLADDWEDGDWPADYDGSAKIALEAIERSHAAWLTLVDQGRLSMAAAHPYLSELVWLGEVLEREFPKARQFVRAGFDEPDEVAKLGLEPAS